MIKLRFFIGQGFLAFLPALVVLLLSRADAEQAADLSVTFGLVGAIFSIAYFGQRAYVTIRGFEVIPCGEAVSFRAFLTLCASGLTLACVAGMGLGLAIAAFAAALKLSEGIIDLWLGIRIRLTDDRASSRAFLVVSLARAAAIALPIIALGAAQAIGSAWLLVYLLVLTLALYGLAYRDLGQLGIRDSYRLRIGRLSTIAWELRGFLSAIAACAVLSSLPRLILPYSDRGGYASAALALSLVPIFAVACNSIWIANLKRMSGDPRRNVRRFLLEVLGVVAGSALLWPLFRGVARLAYGLESVSDQEDFATMVVAGVVLTGMVCLSNLFKLTRYVRHESFNYLLGAGTILVAVFFFGATALAALLIASVVMGSYIAVVFPRVLGAR